MVHELRTVDREDAASVRAAIAKARPVLGVDQDVQLLVGDLLISRGDPVDGLAWQLLACMHCTQADERIGHGCAAEGLCDPNLAYVDVLKRDFGEPMVAEALARMEEIKARIAINDPAALAIFTEIDDKRFPREVGECVQLRTPTPECPPEEILRQTQEAYETAMTAPAAAGTWVSRAFAPSGGHVDRQRCGHPMAARTCGVSNDEDHHRAGNQRLDCLGTFDSTRRQGRHLDDSDG